MCVPFFSHVQHTSRQGKNQSSSDCTHCCPFAEWLTDWLCAEHLCPAHPLWVFHFQPRASRWQSTKWDLLGGERNLLCPLSWYLIQSICGVGTSIHVSWKEYLSYSASKINARWIKGSNVKKINLRNTREKDKSRQFTEGIKQKANHGTKRGVLGDEGDRNLCRWLVFRLIFFRGRIWQCLSRCPMFNALLSRNSTSRYLFYR